MRILGIETSCDETAVCLLEASGESRDDFKYRVLGNALHSQIALHAQYGGVFPNLAKREHAKNLVLLLEHVLGGARARTEPHSPGPSRRGAASVPRTVLGTMEGILEREPGLYAALEAFLGRYERPDIDAIAVTSGPGLEPTLWVGINFAKALALVWNIPIVAVNHLEGHILMALTEGDTSGGRLAHHEFPLVALLISGGHTELDLMPSWMEYRMLGQTRDDAVGEAFDKVARMLGLPYPGGPEIARYAEAARATRRAPHFLFSRPMLNQDNFDFSFSGLKTEVRKAVSEHAVTDELREDVARAFEDAAADVLVRKAMRAVEEYGAQGLVIGGGVSANTYIRQRLATALEAAGNISLFAPPPALATDNAIMIALAGYFHALYEEFADPETIRADANRRLE